MTKRPKKRLVEVLVWTQRSPPPYQHNRAIEPRPGEKSKTLNFCSSTFETKTTSAKGMKSSKSLPTFSTSTDTLTESFTSARCSSIRSRFSLFLPSRWIQLKSSNCNFLRSWRVSSGKPNAIYLNESKIWNHQDWCELSFDCQCCCWQAPLSLGRCGPSVWKVRMSVMGK